MGLVALVDVDEQRRCALKIAGALQRTCIDRSKSGDLGKEIAYRLLCLLIVAANNGVRVERRCWLEQVSCRERV